MSGEGREFIAELKRLADPDDLPRILNACRGRRVHLARGDVRAPASRTNWLVRAIGRAKAQALIQRFRTESWLSGDIDVPMDNSGYVAEHRRKRDEAFQAAIKAGKSSGEIAAMLGITRRAVNIRKVRLRMREEQEASALILAIGTGEHEE